MINMFSQMACICHFFFYVLPRASMGISDEGSFPVGSGGSLIIISNSLGVGI